jgi:Flp pilus assembly protein TadG
MRNLILRLVRAGLARRLTGLRGDGGRGAIGVLVAVLIGTGVLLGMAALVVDVGQLYQNRAELQNGADAAALAVAKSCTEGTCTPSVAAQYANANASKLTGGKACVNFVTGVTGVNGTVAVSWGPGASTCAAAKNVCPPNPPAGANYVDVETSTLMPNGSSLLPPVFAETLAGTHTGSTVYACAQAEWGGPATSATAGFTISACDWDGATGVGTSFAPQPPYPTGAGPYPSYQPYDHLVFLKGGPTGGCTTEPAAQNDSPGNFGWTDDLAKNCTTVVKSGTYGGSTGNSVDQYCKDPTMGLPYWQANRKVLAVPVYVSVANPGNNAVYTLKGFAAFVITGYNLPGTSAKDWVTGSVPNCGNGNTCISGFFTHELVSTTGSFGGVNLGATMMKLTG